MPWKEVSIMSQRREFVALAQQESANRRALCRAFGISPTTGYRWLRRYQAHGPAGLQERSRKPPRSPPRTASAIEQRVLQLRAAHPAWGGRKIRRRFQQQRVAPLPSASTSTAIVRRHDRLAPTTNSPQPWQRFERPVPNDLWQMDFKGHFPLLAGGRCHPLTVWLLRLGVRVIHGRPYHPQTQGKAERFHRTLQTEVLRDRTFPELATGQAPFTPWRTVYNCERPHEALGDQPPVRRYQPSPAPLPSGAAPDRVRPRSRGAAGASQGRDCAAWPVLPWGTGLSGLSGGRAAAAGPRPRDGAVLSRNHRRVGLTAPRWLILCRPLGVHHVSEHLSTMSPVYTP